MTDKEFIGRIWSIIREVGSQKKLGDTLGINPTVINNWVNRGSFPSTEHLANLKEKLNININWLITGIGPRYITESRVGYAHQVAEEQAEYGRSKEEREYAGKLVKIMRTKMDGTVLAIKQNIDAFLTTPDKDDDELKKTA